MEIIDVASKVIRDLGFPIFVACYLLLDLSKRLSRIENHLKELNSVVCKNHSGQKKISYNDTNPYP